MIFGVRVDTGSVRMIICFAGQAAIEVIIDAQAFFVAELAVHENVTMVFSRCFNCSLGMGGSRKGNVTAFTKPGPRSIPRLLFLFSW